MFEELASILCKTSGVADVLPPRAGPGADPGGVRLRLGGRRKERAGSDVDLMVIGELIRAGRQAVASRAEVLGREISPKGIASRVAETPRAGCFPARRARRRGSS